MKKIKKSLGHRYHSNCYKEDLDLDFILDNVLLALIMSEPKRDISKDG